MFGPDRVVGCSPDPKRWAFTPHMVSVARAVGIKELPEGSSHSGGGNQVGVDAMHPGTLATVVFVLSLYCCRVSSWVLAGVVSCQGAHSSM
jgi:hypothetical protein